MKYFRYTFLLVLVSPVVIFPRPIFAQLDGVEYQWEDQRDRDGILIQTSEVTDSKFRAVRGEMKVNGTINSLVALVEDMDACPKWADLCKESRVEKRVSETESYVYVYNNVPFPITDRDVYTHVVWTIDPNSKRVTMTSKATPGGTPKTKAVRIQDAVSQWRFSTNEKGTTTVESFAHIDPNGPTPAWITNMLLVDSPYKTMTNMREIIESGGYADVRVPFLDEF